jgi:hypothetical protein
MVTMTRRFRAVLLAAAVVPLALPACKKGTDTAAAGSATVRLRSAPDLGRLAASAPGHSRASPAASIGERGLSSAGVSPLPLADPISQTRLAR